MYDGDAGRFKHMTRTEAKFKAGASKCVNLLICRNTYAMSHDAQHTF